MKKILSIALVALLAASAVFAGITGSASFSSGYDLDENVFSLSNPKSSDSTFSFEFDASTAGTEAPESGIYADFSGSVTANMTEDGLSVKADLKDALIKSTDGLWSVNLTKVANGVEVTYAGFASQVYYKNQLNWGAKLTTPEYAIIEGLTVSANVAYDVAANDFTDSANWSNEIVKSDIADAIAEKEAEYFKQHDNGKYYDATLADKQEAVADAEKALKDAKAAFAKEQTEDNYKAIADKEDKLAKAQADLKDAIAAAKNKFMAANPDLYEATTTYKETESWKASTSNVAPAGTVKTITIDPTEVGKIYYVFDDYSFAEAEGYDPVLAKSVVYTFKAEGTKSYVYLIKKNVATTTYALKDEHYEFGKAVADKKTVAGGLTIAYAKDLFAASVAGNVKYETVAKAVGFDVTAKASYDFVSGSVSFERTTDEENLLGAGVEATYAGITAKVSASDILAKDEGRLISAEVGGTVAGVTAKVSGAYNFGNDFHKTGVGSLTVAAEAAYAFDFVSVKAKVTGGSAYAFDKDGDYKEAKVTVAPELTLTNNTLIQNAELSLAWAGAKFSEIDPKKGAVTAKIAVKF